VTHLISGHVNALGAKSYSGAGLDRGCGPDESCNEGFLDYVGRNQTPALSSTPIVIAPTASKLNRQEKFTVPQFSQ
jgi:hypothetical protein